MGLLSPHRTSHIAHHTSYMVVYRAQHLRCLNPFLDNMTFSFSMGWDCSNNRPRARQTPIPKSQVHHPLHTHLLPARRCRRYQHTISTTSHRRTGTAIHWHSSTSTRPAPLLPLHYLLYGDALAPRPLLQDFACSTAQVLYSTYT